MTYELNNLYLFIILRTFTIDILSTFTIDRLKRLLFLFLFWLIVRLSYFVTSY